MVFNVARDGFFNNLGVDQLTIYGTINYGPNAVVPGLCPNHLIIRRLEDLPDPVGGVITLAANTLYQPCGIINLQGNTLQLSAGTVLWSQSVRLNGFFTNNTNAAISSTLGAFMSCIFIENSNGTAPMLPTSIPSGPGIDVSGTATGVTGSSTFFRCVMLNCTIGINIHDIAVVNIDTCGFRGNGNEGVRLSTTTIPFSEVRYMNVFHVGLFNSAYIGVNLQASTQAQNGSLSFLASGFNFGNGTSQTFFNINTGALANIDSLLLTANQTSDPTVGPTTNVPINANVTTDPTVTSTSNVGIPDSLTIGGAGFVSNVTATVNPGAGTFADITTGVAYTLDSNSERISLVTGPPAELQYDGKEAKTVAVTIVLAVIATTINTNIGIRTLLNGLTVIPESTFSNAVTGLGIAALITTTYSVNLQQSDTIRVQIANNTDGLNLTVQSCRMTII